MGLDLRNVESRGYEVNEEGWREKMLSHLVTFAAIIFVIFMFLLFAPWSDMLHQVGAPSVNPIPSELPKPEPTSVVPNHLRLPEIKELSGMSFPLRFAVWKDEDHLLYMMGGEVLQVDIRNNTISQFIGSKLMPSELGRVHDIQLSADFTYILKQIGTDVESLNPEDQVYIYEIMNRITGKSWKVGVTHVLSEVQQGFAWSPVGSHYTFVQEGQLFYVEGPESKTTIRISDGNYTKMNGMHDWVYTEEIFDRNKRAIWWSPSGSQIAFVTHNPNEVEKIMMTAYVKGAPYPTNSDIPYPKTLTRLLPIYNISIWDYQHRQAKNLKVKLSDSHSHHYLISVNWVQLFGKEILSTVWANRYQNRISITLCDYAKGQCYLVHEYTYGAKQWAMPTDYQSMQSGSNSLFVIVPKPYSDGNYYNHVIRLTIPKNWQTGGRAIESTLSIGPFDVSKIERYDEQQDLIYFEAQAPSPGDQHIYVTKASQVTETESILWNCLSCITENCSYQSNLLFSPEGKRLFVPCRGPGIPYNLVGVLAGKYLTNVTKTVENPAYAQKQSQLKEPINIHVDIQLPNGYDARIQIALPHQPQPGSRRLPVLLKVYGGPGFQSVTNDYKWSFEKWLGLNKSMAVITIDGRGSGGRGWKYRSPIYGALGSVEMQDQIDALKLVMAKYDFLDNQRKFVYGWSYGGFAAANIVEMAPENYFKCAVSIAPVSNFLYYDATYTERYMGSANSSAYNAADLSRNVSKFRGTKLLLMHGLYDDNVHFQNSALFIEELQKQMVDFELMVFPNQDHSIGAKRMFVYKKFGNFIDKCLK